MVGQTVKHMVGNIVRTFVKRLSKIKNTLNQVSQTPDEQEYDAGVVKTPALYIWEFKINYVFINKK
jgi:hypothetical protein